MRTRSSRTSRTRGQAMVEFLYVAPVLALFIAGSFQFILIYQAKTTLNYAAYETARAGAVNNARMWAMELAFSRAMAPMYTTPYTRRLNDDNDCTTDFTSQPTPEAIEAGAPLRLDPLNDPAHNVTSNLDDVVCARERVRDLIHGADPTSFDRDEFVRILLINPNEDSFTDFKADVPGVPYEYIPNDNLMYRSSRIGGVSQQSIQDANLIKVHVSFCYELVVPVIDRLLNAMVADPPDAENPWNFGAATGFNQHCTAADGDPPRFGIPLHAHAVMRMQSDAIRDRFCGGYCPP